MNYEELVKALRWCDASFLHECGNCLYVKYKHCKDDCMDRMLRDAAAAIEELQSILTEADKKQAYQHDYICELVAEKEELQAETERLKAQLPKRGEWINSKERMRPDMCSVCGCIYEADRFMDKIAWNYCPNCGAKMEVQE